MTVSTVSEGPIFAVPEPFLKGRPTLPCPTRPPWLSPVVHGGPGPRTGRRSTVDQGERAERTSRRSTVDRDRDSTGGPRWTGPTEEAPAWS